MTNPQLRNFPVNYLGKAAWMLIAVGVWQSAAQCTTNSLRLPLPAGLHGPFASVHSGNKSAIVGSRDDDLRAVIYSDSERVEAALGPGSAAQLLEVGQALVALGWNEGSMRLAVVSWTGDVIAAKTIPIPSLSVPSMAVLSIDRVVVVWTSASDGDGTGVSACLLSLSLDTVRCGFRVNAFTQGNQGKACAAPRGTGFAVVWASAGTRDGLFMQEFDAEGVRVGEETTVSLVPGFERCAFPSRSLLLAVRSPSPAESSELYFQRSPPSNLTKLLWHGLPGDLSLSPAALLEDESLLIATNTRLWTEGLRRTAVSRVRADGCIYWSQRLAVDSLYGFTTTSLAADANSATLLMLSEAEAVVARCEWPPLQDCSEQPATFPAWTKAPLPAEERRWPLLAVIIPLAAAGLCMALLGGVTWTWVRRKSQSRLPTHLPASSSAKSMDSISLRHGAALATDIILDIQATEASPVKFPMPTLGRDD